MIELTLLVGGWLGYGAYKLSKLWRYNRAAKQIAIIGPQCPTCKEYRLNKEEYYGFYKCNSCGDYTTARSLEYKGLRSLTIGKVEYKGLSPWTLPQ